MSSLSRGVKYLFFTGWSRGVTVPFYLAAGVAISDDDGRTFRRVSLGPLLDRNAVDPYLTASPFVLVDKSGWRMWYVSGTGWEPSPRARDTLSHPVRRIARRIGLDQERDRVPRLLPARRVRVLQAVRHP